MAMPSFMKFAGRVGRAAVTPTMRRNATTSRFEALKNHISDNAPGALFHAFGGNNVPILSHIFHPINNKRIENRYAKKSQQQEAAEQQQSTNQPNPQGFAWVPNPNQKPGAPAQVWRKVGPAVAPPKSSAFQREPSVTDASAWNRWYQNKTYGNEQPDNVKPKRPRRSKASQQSDDSGENDRYQAANARGAAHDFHGSKVEGELHEIKETLHRMEKGGKAAGKEGGGGIGGAIKGILGSVLPEALGGAGILAMLKRGGGRLAGGIGRIGLGALRLGGSGLSGIGRGAAGLLERGVTKIPGLFPELTRLGGKGVETLARGVEGTTGFLGKLFGGGGKSALAGIGSSALRYGSAGLKAAGGLFSRAFPAISEVANGFAPKLMGYGKAGLAAAAPVIAAGKTAGTAAYDAGKSLLNKAFSVGASSPVVGASAEAVAQTATNGGKIAAGAAEAVAKPRAVWDAAAGKWVAKDAEAAVPAVEKVAEKAGASVLEKDTAKIAGKAVGKTALKSIAKKLPIIGALAGIGFGIQRALKGDWVGAAGEVGSGLAGATGAGLTGIGTAALVGVDLANAAHEEKFDREHEGKGQFGTVESDASSVSAEKPFVGLDGKRYSEDEIARGAVPADQVSRADDSDKPKVTAQNNITPVIPKIAKVPDATTQPGDVAATLNQILSLMTDDKKGIYVTMVKDPFTSSPNAIDGNPKKTAEQYYQQQSQNSFVDAARPDVAPAPVSLAGEAPQVRPVGGGQSALERQSALRVQRGGRKGSRDAAAHPYATVDGIPYSEREIATGKVNADNIQPIAQTGGTPNFTQGDSSNIKFDQTGGGFNSKAPVVMKKLMADFGLNEDEASAIVGNLGHESNGFKTLQEVAPSGKDGRGGYGWAQWTDSRRSNFENYAKENKLDPKSDEANYGFLKKELSTTYKSSLDSIRGKSREEGTKLFMDKFEAPNAKYANLQSRLDYGKRVTGLMDQAPDLAAVTAKPDFSNVITGNPAKQVEALEQPSMADDLVRNAASTAAPPAAPIIIPMPAPAAPQAIPRTSAGGGGGLKQPLISRNDDSSIRRLTDSFIGKSMV